MTIAASPAEKEGHASRPPSSVASSAAGPVPVATGGLGRATAWGVVLGGVEEAPEHPAAISTTPTVAATALLTSGFYGYTALGPSTLERG